MSLKCLNLVFKEAQSLSHKGLCGPLLGGLVGTYKTIHKDSKTYKTIHKA